MTEKDEKPRRENAIKRYFRETIGELRKVTWPTRQEATNLTIIVLIVMAGMSIFLFTIDELTTWLLALALGT